MQKPTRDLKQSALDATTSPFIAALSNLFPAFPYQVGWRNRVRSRLKPQPGPAGYAIL
jgi:hypothetical protein